MRKNKTSCLFVAILSLLVYLPIEAHACSIQFTSPARGSTVSTATVNVSGTASGFANTGNVGSASATVNGVTFFSYTGTFTTALNFFGSGSATATLQPGSNILQVTGSVSGCSASDSMVVFYSPPQPAAQKNGGEPKDPNCTNPVNGATGNKFQTEVDFAGGASLPLEFTRYYNSAYTEARSLGKGWRHNYDSQLTINGSVAYIVRPDGDAFHFTSSGSNWVSDGDINDRLSQVTVGGVTQWQFIRGADNTTEYYDTNGRLSSVVNPAGRTLVMTPDTFGRLATVTDQYSGQKLQFTYDASNRISTLTDPVGNVYTYQYGDNVHLTSVSYPSQSGTPKRQYTYNESAYNSGASLPDALTGITDENGVRFASYTYDTQGRGIVTEHAIGDHRYTLSYNADGTTTVTDPLGAARTYGFQTILNVKRKSSQNQPPGAGCSASSSAVTYDANGNAASRTDFNGNQTTYTYDLTRNLETQRVEGLTSAGASTSATRTITTQWHPDWRLATRVAEPLKITTLVYNSQPDPSNSNAVLTCAPTTAQVNGKPIAVLCKRIEQATTDANGSLGFAATAATGAQSTRIWSFTYNSIGQVLTADGPRTDVADVTTSTYYSATDADPNKRGNLATLADALGHVWNYTAYDANGRLLSMTDPNGTVTSYTYAPRGWLLTVTIGGKTTTLTYDNVGQLTQVTRPDQTSMSYVYDAAHRLTDIDDATGHRLHYVLDAMGNPTQTQYLNADGSVAKQSSQSFDALNRVQSAITGDLSQPAASYGYYANGERKTLTTPKSATTNLSIDSLGRTTQNVDPVNGSAHPTQLGYDGQDRLVSMAVPNGASTSYAIDGLGNRNQETSSETGTTNATYDPAGNVLIETDARGVVTTYTYDALNRPLTMSTNHGLSRTYTWDSASGCSNGLGHLCQITDSAGSTTYNYDARGNRVSQTRIEGGNSFTTQYTWNDADRLISEVTPTGETIAATRDNSGQIQSLSATSPANVSTSVASSVSYDATGNIYTQMLGLSLLNMTFDTAGRLSAQTGTDTTISSGGSDADAPLPLWSLVVMGAGLLGGMARKRSARSLMVLMLTVGLLTGLSTSYLTYAADLSLQYDPNGNVSSKVTPSGTSTYTYDALDRLNTESGPAGNRTHSFDGNDNRTSDGAGTTATFTANSDRIATINGIAVTLDAAGNITSDGTYQYVWDDWGNLKEVHLANGTLLATYYYDDQHLRTRKVTTTAAPQGASTTYYHYDEQGHLLGESASASTPLMTYLWNRDTLTGLIVHQPQRTVYTVQVDQLGSPFQVRTLAGKVVWRWESEAFGKTLPNEDVDGDGQKLTLNLRFPGQYYDRESGLHYNWQRYYSPKLARYLSPDPIGIQGGGNRFAYVNGNPLNHTDPLGLSSGIRICFFGVCGPPIGGSGGGSSSSGNSSKDDDSGGLFPSETTSGSSSSASSSSSSSSGSQACKDGDKCKERKNYCINFCQYELDFPGRTGADNTAAFRRCVRRCMEQAGCSY